MNTSTTAQRRTTGVRKGTAQRRGGKQTAARVIEAAMEVLSDENYSGFSLRNVAQRADIALANLQYYFPRREDLIFALFDNLRSSYETAYSNCIDEAGPDPYDRFTAIIRFNLNDITNKKTRRFFLQLWALLDTLDNHSGEMLGQLYAIDTAQLTEHIAALEPDVRKDEVNRRAIVLAAMIEGLMVVLGPKSAKEAEPQLLLADAENQALAIARGIR